MGNCNACAGKHDFEVPGGFDAQPALDEMLAVESFGEEPALARERTEADLHEEPDEVAEESNSDVQLQPEELSELGISVARLSGLYREMSPGEQELPARELQLAKISQQDGFFAVLDQAPSTHGNSSNLKLYGIKDGDNLSEAEVEAKVHNFRARIMQHEVFDESRILGCMLTEKSLESTICGMPCAKYLWERRGIIPLISADLGMLPEQNGVQLVKANRVLFDRILDSAATHSIFGVKVRSVIRIPNAVGIKSLIDQQFQICQQIMEKRLVPILQPEIQLFSPDKMKCEQVLVDVLIDTLDKLPSDVKIILVLTLPTNPNLYLPLTRHANILRVAALSGGYDRATACKLLQQNVGVVASFARALCEDLSAGQSDEDFHRHLNGTCNALFQASQSVDDSVEKMARLSEQPGFCIALTARSVCQMLPTVEQGHDTSSMTCRKFDSAGTLTAPEVQQLEECAKRIITSARLSSTRVIAVIMTQDFCSLDVGGMLASKYLWTVKGIIPIMIFSLKMQAQSNGVQLMEQPQDWEAVLDQAVALGVFGVQLRGKILLPNQAGIDALVKQQFVIAIKMMEKGLVPNLLLEVDINAGEKGLCEEMLLNTVLGHLGNLTLEQKVTFALSIPSKPNFYSPLIGHPNTVRVGAPSGGYSCADTCRMLSENDGMIGMFGRAFTEGLSISQEAGEFDALLADTSKVIHEAAVAVSAKEEQMMKVNSHDGFFMILDNTGPATSKALKRYGIDTDKHSSRKEINSKMHQMIVRIVTNDHFSGSRVVGTIISKNTMDLAIGGLPSAKYLWSQKGTVPFLKIDNGLMPEANGVQLMQFGADDVSELTDLLDRAAAAGIFGTKQRSFIKLPNAVGIKAVVDQQLNMALHVCAKGLLPILQLEVDIGASEKAQCEHLLLDALLDGMEKLKANEKVALLLTLPTKPNLYLPLMGHPNVIRLIALSGGYNQKVSCKMLKSNVNMIAGFGRAFVEGMHVQLRDGDFTKVLENSSNVVFNASKSVAAKEEQLIKLTNQNGFFVGFDQDAASMPKLLAAYGITSKHYSGDDTIMMEKAHELCTRCLKNLQFNGSRCIGIILTEHAVALTIERLPTAKYLWERLRIVPFMKVSQGLAEEADGVCLMKEIRHLRQRLDKAIKAGVRGTITRSLIRLPSPAGVRAIVQQQIKVAKQVMLKGLVPIMQVEVDISSPDKAKCERLLVTALCRGLEELAPEQRVIMDLTLPTAAGTYNDLIKHPNVIRVAALSGGYSQAEACEKLEHNVGMVACFGRAFTEGLHVTQTEKEFTAQMVQNCKLVYNASRSASVQTGKKTEEVPEREEQIMGA